MSYDIEVYDPRVLISLLLSTAAAWGMRRFWCGRHTAAPKSSISGEDAMGNPQVTFIPFF